MVAAPVSYDDYYSRQTKKSAASYVAQSANFSKKSKHPDKPTANMHKVEPAASLLLKKSDNDDLARLSVLNEQTVLDQLKLRFAQNKIYVN